jgi:hypothetical protein
LLAEIFTTSQSRPSKAPGFSVQNAAADYLKHGHPDPGDRHCDF